MMFETIKELCRIDGVSGREQAVSSEIIRRAEPLADLVETDNLGNVIAFKKGAAVPKNRLMLAAHMDEVGMIITSIDEDGLLHFDTVGGVNSKVIAGRRVKIGENGVAGVVGVKPVHLLEAEEKGTAVPVNELTIDIGADSREQACEVVSLGDAAYFWGDYLEFGDGFLTAKALDDRAGCAILLEIMKEDLPFDTYFVFTVQEEIGARGAKAAAYTVNPDIAIVVETTASGDVSGVEGEKRVARVGGGAVVTYMDHGTIYDRELYQRAFALAAEEGIPCQTKTMIAGGNDSGEISVSRGGVRTVAVSVPCRYLHSPANMAKKSDVEAVYRLSRALTHTLGDI